MDCRQVRAQIAKGREGRQAVRRHLRACAECQAFQQRLKETEALLSTTAPFSAPEALSQRLLALIPQAAADLQARGADRTSTRAAARRRWFQLVLLTFIGLLLFLGISLGHQLVPMLQSAVEQAGDLLPQLPSLLSDWGGQLSEALSPVLEILRLAALFMLLALILEYGLRRSRTRSATTESPR